MLGRPTPHDERLVSSAMHQLSTTAVDVKPLPDPAFLWWKAQLLRRFDAEREATTPLDIGEQVHVGVAVLGALALAFGAWTQLPLITTSPGVGLAVGAGALVLLSIVGAVAFEAIRHR